MTGLILIQCNIFSAFSNANAISSAGAAAAVCQGRSVGIGYIVSRFGSVAPVFFPSVLMSAVFRYVVHRVLPSQSEVIRLDQCPYTDITESTFTLRCLSLCLHLLDGLCESTNKNHVPMTQLCKSVQLTPQYVSLKIICFLYSVGFTRCGFSVRYR